MEKHCQFGFYMHYGDGVCNIVRRQKDFYAENIKSDYKVKCTFVSGGGK